LVPKPLAPRRAQRSFRAARHVASEIAEFFVRQHGAVLAGHAVRAEHFHACATVWERDGSVLFDLEPWDAFK
jgi:hypothetical protein